MVLFGVIWVRKGKTMSEVNINHEEIHIKQERELLYLGFWLWYVLEWVVHLLIKLYKKVIKKEEYNAYRNISFEKEAYKNHYNLHYLKNRELFTSFRDYLFKK